MIAIRERANIVRAWGRDWEAVASSGASAIWGAMHAPAATKRVEAPLASLPEGELSRRFHGWRGRSGRRYVCTIFTEFRSAVGLADAVVIAVRRGADGQRQALFAANTGGVPLENDFAEVQAAAAARGACEWHVHLLASHPDARQQMVSDLGLELMCAWNEMGRH